MINVIFGNPFAFLGIVWLLTPGIIGVISAILSACDLSEVVTQWDKKTRKAGLPRLLLIVMAYNLLIACIWGVVYLLGRFKGLV